MTARYDAELAADSREVLLVFELILKLCSNTIGDASGGGNCTVSPIPADGAMCDYTLHTCHAVNSQPLVDFAPTDVSFRFASRLSSPSDFPELLEAAWEPRLFHCLTKVAAIGQQVDVEDGFTRPNVLEIEFSEMGGAVFLADGTVHDFEQCPEFNLDKASDKRNRSRMGLWFRRLEQMYPNLKGAKCKLWRGFVRPDFEVADMEEVWRGEVENLTTEEGKAKLRCTDWLAVLEQQVPPATDAEITADLSTETTTIPVIGIQQFTDPASISGNVVVRTLSTWTGRYEYMTVTGLDRDGGDVGGLTVDRGTHGSQKEPHAKGQLLEEVYTTITKDGLSGMTVAEIAEDLLDRTPLTTAEYDATRIAALTKWTGSWQFQRTVPEEGERPEKQSIRGLLFELIGDVFIGNMMIDNSMKLFALTSAPAEPSETVQAIAEQDIKLGTLSRNLNEGSRLTAVVMHFGKVPGDDKYLRRVVVLNGETTAEGYWEGRKTKKIESQWLSVGHKTLAQQSAVLRNLLFAFPAERLKWESELRAAGLQMGDLCNVTAFSLQTTTGAARTHNGRLVGKEWDGLAGFVHTSQHTGYDPSKKWAYIQANGLTDYDSATAQQRADGAFLGQLFDGTTHDTDDFGRADETPLASPWSNLGFSGDEFDLVDQRVTAKDTGVITNPTQHMEKTGSTPLTANGYGFVQARLSWHGNPNDAMRGGVGGHYKISTASVHALLRTIRTGGVDASSVEVVTGLGTGRISHGSAPIPTLVEGRVYTLKLVTLEKVFRVYLDGVLVLDVVPNNFWWPYAGGSRRPSLVIEGTGDRGAGWWTFDDLEAGEPDLEGVRVGSSLDPGYCII